MSTINYTYNVIVDRFRQFAAGHFQLRRFTHGEISQADLEKEAEWPWLHVKPRAINYSPGTRSFSFEIFISDLPRDKEDKTGYQAESITDCSLIFQDLINEIYLGNMFGSDVVLTRPVNAEPFVEQYTHTLTGVTGTIELNLDYDWSACSIPASWNYNTPTDSPSDGWGALQFIESLDQNGVFVSLLNDVEAPGNSYYYGTNASGVKGWYAIVDNVGLTCETLPDCATIISIVDDIAALESGKVDKVAGKGLSTEDYTTAEKSKLAGIEAGAEVNVNADWNAVSGDAQILNKPTIPSIAGLVPETRSITINGTTQDLSADRTFTIATGLTVGTTPITSGTVGRVLFEGTGNVLQESANLFWDNTNSRLGIGTASPTARLDVIGGASNYALHVLNTATGAVGGTETFLAENTNASGQAAFIFKADRIAYNSYGGMLYGGSTQATAGLFGAANRQDKLFLFADGVNNLGMYVGTLISQPFVIGTNNLERMRIFGGGNVAIGTTTDAGFRLDVVGSDARINTLRIGLGGGQQSTNTAIGVNALSVNTTGSANTAVGYLALASSNTTGTSNSAFGYLTMRFSTGGSNSAFGTAALYGITSGSNNSAFGRDAGYYIADGATPATSLNSSVFIGANTKALADAQTNQIVIGHNAIGLGSNSVVLGNSSITLTALRGNVLINTTTDAGFKLDVNGTARVSGTTTITPAALTGSAATSALDISQTWNTTGTPIALKVNITDTASASLSDLINLQVGGVSKFRVVKTGFFSFVAGGDILGNLCVGGSSINASSQLEVRSTTRGFLPPRMTTTQKNAIASPAAGLVVYDTTLGKLCVYTTAWETITSV